jgi:hypothetical protein
MRTIALSLAGFALIMTSASTAFVQAPQRFEMGCSFPHGWNSTDAAREVEGIPNGMNHQCLVATQHVHRYEYLSP